jgi:hypothetical protein
VSRDGDTSRLRLVPRGDAAPPRTVTPSDAAPPAAPLHLVAPRSNVIPLRPASLPQAFEDDDPPRGAA